MSASDGNNNKWQDPSILTTQQLHREILSIRELMTVIHAGLDQTLDEKFNNIRDRFTAIDRYIEQEKSANERAVQKAYDAIDTRFASVNEFRAMLNDVMAKMVSRDEYVTRHDALVELINRLSARVDRHESAQEGLTKGIGKSWTTLVGVIGIVVAGTAILTFILQHVIK